MKKTILITLFLSLLCQNASAAVIKQNDMEEISVTGTVQENGSGEVLISVFGPFDEKISYEDATAYTDKLYVNAVYTEGETNYTFSYAPTVKNKFYAVSVNNDGVQETAELFFADNELFADVLEELNQASDVKTVFEKEEYKDILVNNYKSFSQLSDAQKKCVYADLNDEKGDGYQSFSEFELVYRKATAVQSINTSADTAEVQKIVSEYLPIDSAQLYEVYKSFDDTQQNRVFERMIGRDFVGIEEFYQVIEESIFLEKIQNEEFASNLTAFIKKYAEDLDLTLGSYQSVANAVNQKINQQKYQTMEEFETAFQNAVRSASESNSNSGSGGSSGGGGTPSGFYVKPVVPQDSTAENTEYVFDDLGNVSWAEEAILALAEKKIVSGKSEKQFCPNDLITREEFTKMAVAAFDIAESKMVVPFADVPKGSWYYDSVAAAVEGGIIKGVSETEFGTGIQISRQDICVILYRIAQAKQQLLSANGETFSDDAQISDYARECVYALRAAGVVSGFEDQTFAPKSNATRAQAAVMIYAMMEVLS